MRKMIFAAIALLVSMLSFAQQDVKLKIVDENNQALQGASVVRLSTREGKITDKLGIVVFSVSPGATPTFEISFLGYKTTQVSATVGQKTVKLEPSSISINEITVTSLRANERSAVTYSNVSRDEIDKRNLGQDIPYLLSLTPSFVATSDAGTGIGYTGFRIRGTDANRVNITVNNVPLNDAESHGTFFVNMPDFASSLSSVQIQRGVGTSSNGAAAFGASINMQTETLNKDPYASISTTLGSFGTNKNTLRIGSGLLENGFAFDARLSNIVSDGYIDRASVDMKSYYFSGGYHSANNVVKFLTFGGNEKTYQAWNGVDADSLSTNRTYNEIGKYTDNEGKTQFYDNQTDNYSQRHYHLNWISTFNNKLSLNTTAHLTRGIGYYEDYKEDRKYNEYLLTPPVVNGAALKRTDLVRQKWLDNYFYGIVAALNYNTDRTAMSIGGAANRYDGDHYGKVIWVRNALNLDKSKDWYRNTGIKDDANIYAKINSEVFDNLFLSADLQYRYIHYTATGDYDRFDKSTQKMRLLNLDETFHFFNPKMGLNYKIATGQNLYASFSIANREPNRNNYTDAGENEHPTFETLYNGEFGYKYQSEILSFGANAYYMHYDNQLILTGKISEIGEMLTTNIKDSYRAGIELSAAVKPASWLRWDVNATFSTNKIRNFVEQDVDVYDADWNWIAAQNDTLGTTDIAYSPNVVANSIITTNFDRIELALFSSYVGKQYFDNTSNNDRSIAAYFVNNFSAKYTQPLNKLKSLDIQLMLNNIFNAQYSTNAYTWYSYVLDGKRINQKRYFPQAGIHFMASATLNF